MRDLLLEEVFSLLEEATKLEKTGRHRIEAATKYYESCYLMRQIVANTENQLNDGCSSTDCNVSQSTRRLLQDKINHYTTRARKLYFDESIADTRPTASRQPSKHDSRPATSVMVELLDDAISVLTDIPSMPQSTDIPSMPQSNPVPVFVLSAKPGTPHRNNRARNTNDRQQHHNKPNRPYRRSKTPRCALATTERRIHLQANLAHSILSKAMDMDEKRFGNPRILHQAIESYTEASELYLSAIQTGNQHIHRLEVMQTGIQRRASSTDGSSKQLVDAIRNTLQILLLKLKRLVSSALDRIEILKHEQRHPDGYPKDLSKQSRISFTSSSSSPKRSCFSLRQNGYAAKENHRNSRIIEKY